MSLLGEAILKGLMCLKPRNVAPQAHDANWETYISWQSQSSGRLFAKYPNFDVIDKTVLEIGCGTGGRTAFLASQGAKLVVGIDINREEIEIANRVCPALFPATARIAQYLVSNEHSRLDIGQFDVVVMTDCMEHVVSPPKMVRLAYDYTAPGGQFFFSSVGWYNHRGSHLDLIPFVNVFFSDETMINVTRWVLARPDYVRNRWDSDPPTARWEGIYNLRDRPGEHLNKLTVSEMKKLVRHSPFRSSQLSVLGFANGRPALRPLDVLRHLPLVQEMYHSLVVAECRRS